MYFKRPPGQKNILVGRRNRIPEALMRLYEAMNNIIEKRSWYEEDWKSSKGKYVIGPILFAKLHALFSNSIKQIANEITETKDLVPEQSQWPFMLKLATSIRKAIANLAELQKEMIEKGEHVNESTTVVDLIEWEGNWAQEEFLYRKQEQERSAKVTEDRTWEMIQNISDLLSDPWKTKEFALSDGFKKGILDELLETQQQDELLETQPQDEPSEEGGESEVTGQFQEDVNRQTK